MARRTKVDIFIAGNGKTGAPRRLLRLASELSKVEKSLELSIVTQKDHEIATEAISAGVVVKWQWKPKLLYRGVRSGGGIKKLFAVVSLIVFWASQAKYILFSNSDVIVFRSTLSGILYFPIFLLSKKKIILDIDFEENGIYSSIARYVSLKRSDMIVSQYNSALEDIRVGSSNYASLMSRYVAIVPGIDVGMLEKFRKINYRNSEKEPVVIVQVASICPRKNQLFTLTIASLVKSRYPGTSVIFRFIGAVDDIDYMSSLKLYVKAHKLENSVEFLGWRESALDIVSTADLLIMPSLNEGVPNAVQEAMCIGVPILASEAGGMSDLVEEASGWALPLLSKCRWVEAIDTIISRPSRSEELGRNARKYARNKFSQESWAKHYAQVIFQLTSKVEH